MESEKVKEIKKALGNCQKNNCLDCPYFIDEKRCRANDLLFDTLTLINELESENERFNECYKVKAYDKLRAENKKLKDRIAEMEEYIKGNEQDAKAFVNGWHKDLETELKRFAEKLKGKFEHCVGDIYHADTIDERIDKTLKEFLNTNKGDDN